MAPPNKKSLRPAGGQNLHLLTSTTWNKIRHLLEMPDLQPDPEQFDVLELAGRKLFRYRVPDPANSSPGSGRAIPFALRSITKGTFSVYAITLYPGWVREIITTAGEGANGIIYHMPEMVTVPLDTLPAPVININIEDYIYVNYPTDDQGNITEAPEIVVSSVEEVTTHYQPPDATGSGGVNGDYFVRIGQLKDLGDEKVLWIPMVNSEILHVQELWTGTNVGGGAGIFKARNPEANRYEHRTVVGRFGNNQEEGADEIYIDFDGTNVGGGLEILKLPEGDPPYGNEPAEHRTLRELNSDDPGFDTASQIKISYADGEASAEGAADTILIRGNSKNFNLIFVTDDASPTEIDRVNFKDGLGTESGDVTIPIPSGGGDLPDGSQGDMLYWNVVEGVGSWTLLANPGAPTGDNLKVLTHNGNIPGWIDFLALVIDICDGGTPTTATIYKSA